MPDKLTPIDPKPIDPKPIGKKDYPWILEHYFQRIGREGEVTPVRYRDGSSYERISATWADVRALPSRAELDAFWELHGDVLEESQDVERDDLLARLDAIEARLTALERT